MDVLKHETGCCGTNFETNHVSFLGLLTFSIPLLILTLPLLTLSSIFNQKSHLRNILKTLFQSNLKLIETKKIFSPLKCKLAGQILRFSPKISGYVFRYFNLTILFFCWILFLTIITLSFKLWL